VINAKILKDPVKEKWNAVIEAKLKEGQSLEDLVHEYDGSIRMEPNITHQEVAHIKHDLGTLKPWKSYAFIQSKDKNKLALEALNQGAEGIAFVWQKENSVDTVFDSIFTEMIETRIYTTELSKDEIQQLTSDIQKHNLQNITLVGSDQMIEIGEKDRVASIQNALSKARTVSHPKFEVQLSKNLLFEIASLRAIRVLCLQNGIHPDIFAKYEIEGLKDLGDHDLIEKTYKIMSGVLGCADGILNEYDGSETARLTLNVHHILDLESKFKWVEDPVNGAFYIEKLTEEIIKQVEQ